MCKMTRGSHTNGLIISHLLGPIRVQYGLDKEADRNRDCHR